MLYEENEDQGKYGKRGKLLRYVGSERRIALHCSSTGTPDRDIHVGEGWSITRRCIAITMDQGGSARIGRQIFPEFVQAQTVALDDVRIPQ